MEKDGMAVWGHASKPGFDASFLKDFDPPTRADIERARRRTDTVAEVNYQLNSNHRGNVAAMRAFAQEVRENALDDMKYGVVPHERLLFTIDVCADDRCQPVNPCKLRWADWGFSYNPTVKESIERNAMMPNPNCK